MPFDQPPGVIGPPTLKRGDAQAVENEAEADHVMWGQIENENGIRVMAYDVPSSLPYDPGVVPVFVSVRGDDPSEIEAYWRTLSADADVVQDLSPSGWSPLYGMLKDRFGVTWVLDVAAPYQG